MCINMRKFTKFNISFTLLNNSTLGVAMYGNICKIQSKHHQIDKSK